MNQPKPLPPKQPKPRKPPQIQARKCPSGFRWDSAKNRCVQAGVGPEYRP